MPEADDGNAGPISSRCASFVRRCRPALAMEVTDADDGDLAANFANAAVVDALHDLSLEFVDLATDLLLALPKRAAQPDEHSAQPSAKAGPSCSDDGAFLTNLFDGAAIVDRHNPRKHERNHVSDITVIGCRHKVEADALWFLTSPFPMFSAFARGMDYNPKITGAREQLLDALDACFRLFEHQTEIHNIEAMAGCLYLLECCDPGDNVIRRCCRPETLRFLFENSDDYLISFLRNSVEPLCQLGFMSESRGILREAVQGVQQRRREYVLSFGVPNPDDLIDPCLTIACDLVLPSWKTFAIIEEADLSGGLLVVAPPFLLELFDRPGKCKRQRVFVAGLLHLPLVVGPIPRAVPAFPDPSATRITSDLTDDDVDSIADAFAEASACALLPTTLVDILLVVFDNEAGLTSALSRGYPQQFAGLYVLPVAFRSRSASSKFPLPAIARHRSNWNETLSPGFMMAAPDVSPVVLCTGVYVQLTNGHRLMVGATHGFFRPERQTISLSCFRDSMSSQQDRLNGTPVYHRDKRELIGRLAYVVDDITRIWCREFANDITTPSRALVFAAFSP
ncbi:unnamed protein product (mitochondrion) [Plasmodiophora brassicae]|uniref:Uncharacterized protein n=1 Tax=Plasmodiophora brassicae TaxID=37360 RepID=A0A3P3YPD5_PLABS|nr:unnamed protein product [Plasmodiophora brassicae]